MKILTNLFEERRFIKIEDYSCPHSSFYKSESDGLTIHRVVLDIGLGNEEKNILLFADTHFATIDQCDIVENNELVLESYNRRKDAFPLTRTQKNVEKILDMTSHFDKVVLAGDTLDFLSRGGLNFIKEHVYPCCPQILILVGNHDDTRISGHKGNDDSTRESREKILAETIKTDIFYHSEKIGNKILLVGMNNCHRRYNDYQKNKFIADIEFAKENDLKIILVQHEMINTGNPSDAKLPAIYKNSEWCYNSAYNFYNGKDKIGPEINDNITRDVYELITHNADVITAVFSGHWHTEAYCEIKGQYVKGGEVITKNIPQYVVASAAYGDGYAMIITVK